MKPEFELLTGGRVPDALKKAGRASEKKKFTGLLSVPLRSKPPGLLDDGKAENAYLKELEVKLNLLLEHYEISKGEHQWLMLAVSLAKEFCPGFKNKDVGPPTKWTEYALGCLVVEMQRERKTCKTLVLAAKTLVRKEPWKQATRGRGGDAFAALLRQYNKGRGLVFAKIALRAFKYHETMGTIAEWDKEVMRCLEPEWY